MTAAFETVVAWVVNSWWLARRVASAHVHWWLGAPRRVARTAANNFVDNVTPRRLR